MKGKEAVSIADRIQEWPNLIQYPSELQIPKEIDRAISQLPSYTDGLQCMLDPASCCHAVMFIGIVIHKKNIGGRHINGRLSRKQGDLVAEELNVMFSDRSPNQQCR